MGGFTESNEDDCKDIQDVYNLIAEYADKYGFDLLDCEDTDSSIPTAYHADNFKPCFEARTGLKHTADNFWSYRSEKLRRADYFLVVRTGVSESTNVEVGWKLARESFSSSTDVAMEDADRWDRVIILKTDPNPIKTTMLRNATVISAKEELTKVLQNVMGTAAGCCVGAQDTLHGQWSEGRAASFQLPTKQVLLCNGPNGQETEFLQFAQKIQDIATEEARVLKQDKLCAHTLAHTGQTPESDTDSTACESEANSATLAL